MSQDELIDRFRARILERKPLRIRGGGSKDFYGGPLAGEVLDTRSHAGIVNYEPTELVVTARAGTPLAELESALAARRQFLACEPPRFGAATVGGAVAAGLSGPCRAAVGSLRDFVLGVKLMDGEGRVHRFGGTLDAILVQGKLALGDWKTSNGIYADYLLQLSAYQILWEENFPDRPITGGFHLLRFSKATDDSDPVSFSHHYWSQLDVAKEQFLHLLAAFKLDKRIKSLV